MSQPLFDLERLRRETFLRRIEYREELASTNDLALELARRDDVLLPLLVLVERQTAGRGRGDHHWWSAAGALTFSILIDIDRERLAPERRPLVSLTTALAIGEALELLVPDADIGLKWPNDVLIQSRKVCGVLLESPSRSGGRMVVGIGLNVNNSLALALVELQQKATSLSDAAQRNFDLTDVLILVLRRFADLFERLATHRLNLRELWTPRCVLTGRVVQLQVGRQSLSGICRGIDDRGALLLETPSGLERCHSGTVCQVT
ncbi:MAG: biotin--[acetyl-CoA-carboxylase] ligase [Planctomycetota bacterium]|nr:biotin--[acetyl-CoA-carboxylase] ligase [Planctomycetota bacterium]